MNWPIHRDLLIVGGAIAALMLVATAVGQLLKRRASSDKNRATVDNLNARIGAWWLIWVVVFFALAAGTRWILVLFGLISFLALREFITLTHTRRADHRTLFWSFFVIIPIQYLLIDAGWYGLFSIFIPVYAFLFVAIVGTLKGDYRQYLDRTAHIQWGLFICVFCLSHLAALVKLEIPGYENRSASLLLFLILVAQSSDVFQYVWGKLIGRHHVAPHISPNKTWEGFVGGIGTAVAMGTAMWWLTPFSPSEAAVMSLVITLMGFAGGVVMSAVKRDAGIKDFGTMLSGHGGMLDRVDSLLFSAPIFFHLTRYYFTGTVGASLFGHL